MALVYRFDWRQARPQGRQKRDVVRRVRRLLREHADPEMREWAAHFLTHWHVPPTPEVRVALLEAFERDADGAVRGQAAEGMASLSQYARCGPLVQRIDDALRRGLTDDDPYVRFWCLYGVGIRKLVDQRDVVLGLVDDAAVVDGWWSVGHEAQDVLEVLEGRPWPDRSPASTSEADA